MRWAGTAKASSCLHDLPLKLSNLVTRECLSVRRSRLSQNTSGPSAFAWNSQDRSAILQFSTWRSTANFALATSSSCAWTTFARDLKYEIGQRSSKRRQGDQCNSKSRSNHGILSKPACRCSELRARDFSFQVAFIQVSTYPPANMLDWCTGGWKA